MIIIIIIIVNSACLKKDEMNVILKYPIRGRKKTFFQQSCNFSSEIVHIQLIMDNVMNWSAFDMLVSA